MTSFWLYKVVLLVATGLSQNFMWFNLFRRVQMILIQISLKFTPMAWVTSPILLSVDIEKLLQNHRSFFLDFWSMALKSYSNRDTLTFWPVCVSNVRMMHPIPFKLSRSHYSGVIMGAMASQITGVSIVYSTVCSGANQRIRQSSASLAFVSGTHPHVDPSDEGI